MARLDYFSIEQALYTQLKNNSTLDGLEILVEEEIEGKLVEKPIVAIYLNGREPTEGQSLAAGFRTRYNLSLQIVVVAVSLESIQKAIEVRDDIIGNVEVAIMSDRTLGGAVSALFLEGGSLTSAKVEADVTGYAAAGDVLIRAQASATT